MQILVFGCQNLTQVLAPSLIAAGHQVTVLGHHQECLALLAKKLPTKVIQASGVLMEDLLSCNMDSTEVFLALSDDDQMNTMTAQIASHIFNVPKVICHVGDAEASAVYSKIGLTIVSSSIPISGEILHMIKESD